MPYIDGMLYERMTLAILCCLSIQIFGQEPHIQQGIEVRRVVLDVRVIDSRGYPIENLQPSDFRLKADKEIIPILSSEWIDAPVSQSNSWSMGEEDPYEEYDPFWSDLERSRLQPEGRLLVIFVQGDLQGARKVGMIRMIHLARKLVADLPSQDYVAVFSFYSHLKIHSDFTRDRSVTDQAMESALFNRDSPYLEAGGYPSIMQYLNREDGWRTASAEKSLYYIGSALRPFDGVKNMIYLGWGLGYLLGNTVHMTRDYGPAIRALTAARTSVFALDITMADAHTLEVGLSQVAEDTGGFYARTFDFPQQAIGKLTRAIVGHYVLIFEPPPPNGKRPRYRLTVPHHKATVMTTNPALWDLPD